MEKRLLGSSGMEVPVFVFGAWAAGGWAWGGVNVREAEAAVRTSLDLGGCAFDTAPVYGYGDSERLVGEALRGISRDRYLLFTKFGLSWDTTAGVFHFDSFDNAGKPVRVMRHATKQAVIAGCEQSLRRLRMDHIDLFQQHWPDPSTPIVETMEALEILKTQGKIRAGGVSNFSPAQMAGAMQAFPVVSNQIPYSMVKREAGREIIPHCRREGLGVLVYSPLQRGLLTGKITSGHIFGEGDTRVKSLYFKEPNLTAINRFLDGLRPLAADKGCTLGQLVLQWTLRQEGITAALVGARNAGQVRQNADALRVVLTPADMAFIRDRLADLTIAEIS